MKEEITFTFDTYELVCILSISTHPFADITDFAAEICEL